MIDAIVSMKKPTAKTITIIVSRTSVSFVVIANRPDATPSATWFAVRTQANKAADKPAKPEKAAKPVEPGKPEQAGKGRNRDD